MARGNDAQAAAAEFRGQYGTSGNAEDLIQANRAAFSADLRSAALIERNEDASNKLDLSKVQGEVEGGTVLDAAVHGDKVIAVVETESGHTYKQVLAHASVGGPKSSRSSAEADTTYADAEAEAGLLRAKANVEAQKAIEEAVQKAKEEASKIVTKARDEANKIIESAAKKAAKADTPDEGEKRKAAQQQAQQRAQAEKERAAAQQSS